MQNFLPKSFAIYTDIKSKLQQLKAQETPQLKQEITALEKSLQETLQEEQPFIKSLLKTAHSLRTTEQTYDAIRTRLKKMKRQKTLSAWNGVIKAVVPFLWNNLTFQNLFKKNGKFVQPRTVANAKQNNGWIGRYYVVNSDGLKRLLAHLENEGFVTFKFRERSAFYQIFKGCRSGRSRRSIWKRIAEGFKKIGKKIGKGLGNMAKKTKNTIKEIEKCFTIVKDVRFKWDPWSSWKDYTKSFGAFPKIRTAFVEQVLKPQIGNLFERAVSNGMGRLLFNLQEVAKQIINIRNFITKQLKKLSNHNVLSPKLLVENIWKLSSKSLLPLFTQLLQNSQNHKITKKMVGKIIAFQQESAAQLQRFFHNYLGSKRSHNQNGEFVWNKQKQAKPFFQVLPYQVYAQAESKGVLVLKLLDIKGRRHTLIFRKHQNKIKIIFYIPNHHELSLQQFLTKL